MSLEKFSHLVQVRAWLRWHDKEKRRRDRNWYEAEHLFGTFSHPPFGIGYSPLREKIRNEAEKVYRLHKDADALEDWLEAEQSALQYYEVAG